MLHFGSRIYGVAEDKEIRRFFIKKFETGIKEKVNLRKK